FFEAEILDYMRDNHNDQKVILDIGANIGNHSVYFANFLKYNFLYAFEPVLDNYLLLEKNISQYPNTFASNSAVNSNGSPVYMYINRGNMGASQVSEEGEY